MLVLDSSIHSIRHSEMAPWQAGDEGDSRRRGSTANARSGGGDAEMIRACSEGLDEVMKDRALAAGPDDVRE